MNNLTRTLRNTGFATALALSISGCSTLEFADDGYEINPRITRPTDIYTEEGRRSLYNSFDVSPGNFVRLRLDEVEIYREAKSMRFEEALEKVNSPQFRECNFLNHKLPGLKEKLFISYIEKRR